MNMKKWTIQIHWQHWANYTQNKDKQTNENSKRNTKNTNKKSQRNTTQKTDEQSKSEQTPRVTPSEWQAVPTSYKTTATLII